MSLLCNLPSKSKIFDHWKDKLSDHNIFIDWDEPSCWACGFHYSDRYDISNSNTSWQKILSCWEKIPLQRCHIVPRSLGGSDQVGNLFLMCRECHDSAPNTLFPQVFFKWVDKQSWWKRECGKITAAFDSFDISEVDQIEIMSVIGSAEFKAWISGRMAFHWPQSNYAPTSSRLTPATIVGLAAYFFQNLSATNLTNPLDQANFCP